MKKFIFTFAIFQFLISFSLSAQIEKGKFLIGSSSLLNGVGNSSYIASFGSSTSKTKNDSGDLDNETKISSFSLTAKMGYSVMDNFVVGLGLTGATNKRTFEILDDKIISTSNLFVAGPFLRYYVPAGKILPYVEGGIKFGTSKNDYGFSDQSDNFGLFGYHGEAGIAIPVGDMVNFDIGLNYSSISSKEKEDNLDNTINTASGIGLNIGFNVWLGRDKE